MEYGCIAQRLGHSFSQVIHSYIGDYDYSLREIPAEELDSFMRAGAFKGINVTIPYKEAVIPYLSHISDTARQIGAVNTVVNRGGALWGYNTDFGGMTALIRRMGLTLAGKKVLVLGTGGTSKTARAVAAALGADSVLPVSRSGREGAITYEQACREHRDAQILINTTPCGMFPEVNAMPVDPAAFPRLEGVVDAVFNPLSSRLVLAARARGVTAEGGLYMLVAQAVLAAEHFTGKQYPAELTERIYHRLLREKRNVVLIGMPGSGKTTVGRIVAQRLGRRFIDLDEEIASDAGCTIPEIFARRGEGGFRDLESAAVERTAALTGAVIATGGGCILRPENVNMLRMNGELLFLDRPPEELIPTGDRPLSDTAGKMRELYDTRLPLYRAAADRTVPVRGDAQSVAASIAEDAEKE